MVGRINADKVKNPCNRYKRSAWTDCMADAIKNHFGIAAVTADLEGGLWAYLEKRAYKEVAKLLKVKWYVSNSIEKSLKTIVSSHVPFKYYVSILTEHEKEIVQKEVETFVGLDFSMDDMLVLRVRTSIILSSIGPISKKAERVLARCNTRSER